MAERSLLAHPLDRVNLLLAGAVAALALWLWHAPGPVAATAPLTTRDRAQVNELRLYQRQELRWSLLRDRGGWTMTHPVVAPADAGRVEELLGLLATPALLRFPAPADLAAYGLATPAYRLALDDLQIAFGDTEPTSGLRYVHSEGRVSLIGDGFHHHLLAGPSGFRAEP